MPLFMVMMLTRFFGQSKSWKEGLEILPFAIFAGLAFTVPYALTGIFLGSEFPSLLGGLVSIIIVVTAAKIGVLVPKTQWDFANKETWPKQWLGNLEIKAENISPSRSMSIVVAWVPYLIVAALLVCSRVFAEF